LALQPQLALEVLPAGLVPTSWDSEIFWMEDTFSFGGAFQSDKSAFAPFMLLEARRAFVVSLMDIQTDTYFSGMSELSSLLFYLRTESHFYSTTNFESSVREYTEKTFEAIKVENYPQMLLWESDISQHLRFLAPHGRLLLASTASMPEIPQGFNLHQKWDFEENSEIGKLYLLELTR
jgi:hypothetical protein